MARLINNGPAVRLYKATGPDSLHVDHGQVVEVPGEARLEGDALIVGSGDNARAFPVAVWSLEEPPPPPKSAPRKHKEN